MIDTAEARRFVQRNGRLLDRRRFAHLMDGATAEGVRSAVAAYGNTDGGYAGLIEPDVRTIDSQPIAALTGFDALHEAGAAPPREAFEWLAGISNDDGGVPFHLAPTDGAPQAPWMQASPGSSLHMTAAIAAAAARCGAQHTWLDEAVAYCLRSLDDARSLAAYEIKYVLHLLDALGDHSRLQSMSNRVPRNGRLPVGGGVEGETLNVLTLSPTPDRPSRKLFDQSAVEEQLREVENSQRSDGGWDFDWLAWEPAVALEWRARLTVDAVATLRAHDRI